MKAVQNIWILFDVFVAILQLSGRVYSISMNLTTHLTENKIS